MPVRPFFKDFEHDLFSIFESAMRDAGERAKDVTLVLEEEPWRKGIVRAEFMVLPSRNVVRFTWCGIGSLWAFAQGAARVSRRMFVGTRNNEKHLAVQNDPELERAMFFFELSKRLCSNDLGADSHGEPRWPDWVPRPAAAPRTDDDLAGNDFLYGALAWIMRHELAHVTLDHENRERVERKPWPEYEREADMQATDWLRGDRQADLNRQLGSQPPEWELELERRAIAIGIATIWIALFESYFGKASKEHPPTAERLFSSFEQLGLREDSGACEIVADSIQAWLDPEGVWSTPEQPFPTARDFLTEAVIRLHRSMSALR